MKIIPKYIKLNSNRIKISFNTLDVVKLMNFVIEGYFSSTLLSNSNSIIWEDFKIIEMDKHTTSSFVSIEFSVNKKPNPTRINTKEEPKILIANPLEKSSFSFIPPFTNSLMRIVSVPKEVKAPKRPTKEIEYA